LPKTKNDKDIVWRGLTNYPECIGVMHFNSQGFFNMPVSTSRFLLVLVTLGAACAFAGPAYADEGSAAPQDIRAPLINPYPQGAGGDDMFLGVRKDGPASQDTAAPVWQAAAGASVEYVLALWSEQGGVAFLWNTEEKFSVPRDLRLEGGYAEAVAALLEQFERQKIKPVGRLYEDQPGGQKVLVVEGS
jgi:hypothetical protein